MAGTTNHLGAAGSNYVAHSRPSSWESEGMEDSDCFTVSTANRNTMQNGPYSPVSTTAEDEGTMSSAASWYRKPWSPLRMKSLRRKSKSKPITPPMPTNPFRSSYRTGDVSQYPRVETNGLNSPRSEYPDIIEPTPSPDNDIEPLPKISYNPADDMDRHGEEILIEDAIGRSSMSLHTDPLPGSSSHTLHSPAYPPIVFGEEYYQGVAAYNEHGLNFSQDGTTAVNSPAFTFSASPKPASLTLSPRPGATSNPGRKPVPIQSPPTDLSGEWHPPPQTPIRALSLAARPATLAGMNPPPLPQGRNSANSSTSHFVKSPPTTRSSPFMLNPNNQQYPAPPHSDSQAASSPPSEPTKTKATGLNGFWMQTAKLTSKWSDDGDGDEPTPEGLKQWKMHFSTPLTMVALFLCGSALAVVHHILYSRLHKTRPGDFQEWILRAGFAIPLFAAACWGACVAMSYKQRVWSTLTQKKVKVSGIDALWGLIHDPSMFLVGETWRKSKVAMLLGLVMWVLPLLVIISPGALSVLPDTFGTDKACVVPSFDAPSSDQLSLMPQADFDRFVATQPAKDVPLSVTSMNTTDLSVVSKRIGNLAAFGGRVIDYPLPQACDSQGNCSYTLSFTAPGYKCDVKTKEDTRTNGPWGQKIFDGMWATGLGQITFYAAMPDNSSSIDPKSSPDAKGLVNLGMGAFWVAYRSLSEQATSSDPNLLLDPSTATESQYTEGFFRCTDYVVSYENIKFQYVDGRMSVVLPDNENHGITYVTSVDYNQFVTNKDGISDSVTLHRVVHDFTLSVLRGNLDITSKIFNHVSKIEGTILVDDNRQFGQRKAGDGGIPDRFTLPKADLKAQVEALHRNIALSFLSEPRLASTSFTPAMCSVKVSGFIYTYKFISLALVYGVLGFLTLVSLVTGLMALRTNGFAADFSFSRILCTTRNPTLDEICRGESCLGTVKASVGRQYIRFGETMARERKSAWKGSPNQCNCSYSNLKKPGALESVDEESETGDVEEGSVRPNKNSKVGHAAFGLDSEVAPLKKNKEYC